VRPISRIEPFGRSGDHVEPAPVLDPGMSVARFHASVTSESERAFLTVCRLVPSSVVMVHIPQQAPMPLILYNSTSPFSITYVWTAASPSLKRGGRPLRRGGAPWRRYRSTFRAG